MSDFAKYLNHLISLVKKDDSVDAKGWKIENTRSGIMARLRWIPPSMRDQVADLARDIAFVVYIEEKIIGFDRAPTAYLKLEPKWWVKNLKTIQYKCKNDTFNWPKILTKIGQWQKEIEEQAKHRLREMAERDKMDLARIKHLPVMKDRILRDTLSDFPSIRSSYGDGLPHWLSVSICDPERPTYTLDVEHLRDLTEGELMEAVRSLVEVAWDQKSRTEKEKA